MGRAAIQKGSLFLLHFQSREKVVYLPYPRAEETWRR